ncbi:class I SAM-dependent methyltransferase [Kutzneria sp. CA-103260]|uniref:class I SAM-dependent methyltransferase n=1 Tax=Kutzneria sp. CA-103260 TaxID=2802641 RepID=UPI001BA59428|nr:class I SAM-dependent methyltransferase [Kutzneria sp. CA-103260]QUQ64865.1 methyltransferase [Kutzneria sp. CA-103260]
MGLSAAELYDLVGKDYETAFADLAARREEIDWLLTQLPPRARVLDVGSGTGRPTAELLSGAGHDVSGFDASSQMVEIARAQVPAAHFEVADLRTVTYPGGSWDAVTAFFSLFQLTRAEIDAALAKFADWLTPGGIFLLATVPSDSDCRQTQFMGHPITVSSYLRETFLDRISAVGLEIVRDRLVEYKPADTAIRPEHDLFLAARKP